MGSRPRDLCTSIGLCLRWYRIALTDWLILSDLRPLARKFQPSSVKPIRVLQDRPPRLELVSATRHQLKFSSVILSICSVAARDHQSLDNRLAGKIICLIDIILCKRDIADKFLYLSHICLPWRAICVRSTLDLDHDDLVNRGNRVRPNGKYEIDSAP